MIKLKFFKNFRTSGTKTSIGLSNMPPTGPTKQNGDNSYSIKIDYIIFFFYRILSGYFRVYDKTVSSIGGIYAFLVSEQNFWGKRVRYKSEFFVYSSFSKGFFLVFDKTFRDGCQRIFLRLQKFLLSTFRDI